MTQALLVPRTSLPPDVPTTLPDERAARQSLRRQVVRLEEELAGLFRSAWPRHGLAWGSGVPTGGARLLGLGELEALRDELAERVQAAQQELAERARGEEEQRRTVEEMLLDPERHRWARVTNEDLGEPGCKSWHVRPRFGVLGMLLRWWRVVVSSGCP
jgi:hypothetical protein